MKTLLIQAWTVHKYNGEYFLPYTHWVYLNEIVKYYERVCLISPTKVHQDSTAKGLVRIDDFKNVEIYELPYSEGYIAALKHFPSYINAYRKLKFFDASYVRYPIPFGWLQKFFFRKKSRIIHFVGDPIDTFRNNPNLGKVKGWLYTTFFLPEHWMYMWACRGAKVYTNGFHLAERLKKYGIEATPMISSILKENDFYYNDLKEIRQSCPKILYLGNLRTAKGVETVIKAFSLLKADYPESELTIIGSGEIENSLKDLVNILSLENVHFLGRIGDRNTINTLLRDHDVFCFASLSEGSPRVVLEAMANGLNVVSTPVGSVPDVFDENEDIIFAGFNNEDEFYVKIKQLIDNPERARTLRFNAFNKVKNNTIENFIKRIFHD